MGAKYYMMYRNRIGGVAGYKFDVDVLDNQLTPAGGAQTVRQFLAARKFLVIIVGTPSATGAFGILEQEGRNVPVLTTGATALIEKLRGEGKLGNVYGEFPNFDKGSLFDMKFLIEDLGEKIGRHRLRRYSRRPGGWKTCAPVCQIPRRYHG